MTRKARWFPEVRVHLAPETARTRAPLYQPCVVSSAGHWSRKFMEMTPEPDGAWAAARKKAKEMNETKP